MTNFEKYWPRKIFSVPSRNLRHLSDKDFSRLRSAVHKRAKKYGSKGHARRLSRDLLIKRRLRRHKNFTREDLTTTIQESELLDAFVAERERKWLPIPKRKSGLSINCKEFSFIDNPMKTMQTLVKLVEADCNAINYNIDFDDKYILDIAPYLVFGVMQEKMAPFCTGGHVRKPVGKVLESVGLREFLGMQPFGVIKMDDVWPLPIKQRRGTGLWESDDVAMEPSAVEKRADKIAQSIDDWLRQLDPPEGLTNHGITKIKSIVTEILNNAERHGNVAGEGEWISAGFMAKRPVSIEENLHSLHICHLCFLNFGRPIAETINDGPDSIKKQIDQYCGLHQSKSLSAGTLATTFAMQDGISRISQGHGAPTGGTGLMDMIEFANEVGRTELEGYSPEVVILSGSSYIKFSQPFNEGLASNDGRRLQWFNANNDAEYTPENSHVLDLTKIFPGTLISMRFVLDQSLKQENS